jgi:hypothetical protein
MPTKVYLSFEVDSEDPTFVDMFAAVASEVLHVQRTLFRGVGPIGRVLEATVRNGVEVGHDQSPKEEPEKPRISPALFVLPGGGMGAVHEPGTPAHIIAELQKQQRAGALTHLIAIAHAVTPQPDGTPKGDVNIQSSHMPKELCYFLSGIAHDFIKKANHGL